MVESVAESDPSEPQENPPEMNVEGEGESMREHEAEGKQDTPAETAPPEPAYEADFDVLCPRVEAALLTSDRAMTAGKLAEALELPVSKPVVQAIEQLNAAYESTGRSFRIEAVAGGYSVMTLPQYADVLLALKRTKGQQRLSPAALETLAIVAYKQPALRADIEAIRGVACGETLRSLMERHLIKIVGRAEEIGRPMLYGTTKQFLEIFGLANLKDLPSVEATGTSS
ncbi:MAG: SMC-Scp complex subunit ScpB [Algisphaera sp.]